MAAATIFGVTVVPLSSLLFALHQQNRKDAAKEAKRRSRRFKLIFARLDHLDNCVDSVKRELQGRNHNRRATDHTPGALP